MSDKPTGECDWEGLIERSDENVDDPNATTKGTKAFTCIEPLPRSDVKALRRDNEGVVMCPFTTPIRFWLTVYIVTRGSRILSLRPKLLAERPRKTTDDVEKVYLPLPSAKEIPLTSWTSKKGNNWNLPVMVGLEGIRMDIPNPDTPLARWRSNLRESLSYTILVTCPDLMINEVNKDWTDMHCVEMLEKVQRGHYLVEGTIPASVYAVAINYFTARALDEGQKASQSIESSARATPHPSFKDDEDVESWGLRPKLPDPEVIRKRKVILLTDSGSMIYRRKKRKVKPGNFLSTDPTDPWTNIMAPDKVGGAEWLDWAVFLEKFILDYGSIMELCPDGTSRGSRPTFR